MRMLGPDCRHARSQNSYGILRYANTHPPNKTLSSLIQEEPGFSHLHWSPHQYTVIIPHLPNEKWGIQREQTAQDWIYCLRLGQGDHHGCVHSDQKSERASLPIAQILLFPFIHQCQGRDTRITLLWSLFYIVSLFLIYLHTEGILWSPSFIYGSIKLFLLNTAFFLSSTKTAHSTIDSIL